MSTRKVRFVVFFCLFFLNSADSKCENSFSCGKETLEFPLTDVRKPNCGLYPVNCEDPQKPTIQLSDGRSTWYPIIKIISSKRLEIEDPLLEKNLLDRSCAVFENYTLPESPSSSLTFSPSLTLFTCENVKNHSEREKEFLKSYNNSSDCNSSTFYMNSTYKFSDADRRIFENLSCKLLQLPVKLTNDSGNLLKLLSAQMEIEWKVSDRCLDCHHRGGQCLSTNNLSESQCTEDKTSPALIVAAAISGGSVILVACLFTCFIIYHRNKNMDSAYLSSRNASWFPSKSDGTLNFSIAIFSYKELEEATNNFDSSKEVGDGGFGTVYYGKLKDGREVAIKCLYGHNGRRLEQFINEIKILTCLRHPNLVSLYGCTSKGSRELLLVYEYVPNSTLADHLHGESAKQALLTWDIRMSIAIETASALAYLHKSDIIHRDVKTDNILLDNSFHVKVADFGLSRLFPTDATHVSTAPQGTPGYVDPEYHLCYQLTNKSDVYSFGVVLIELISSMPAVDINRHRHEINLANLAVNKIQRSAFDELIDSALGYNKDSEITRMTNSVAELALQCLHLEKEFRPSMDEVLNFLQLIQAGNRFENFNGQSSLPRSIPPSPEVDNAALLKSKNFEFSAAVIDVWTSDSTSYI